jgi:hypothetical protein
MSGGHSFSGGGGPTFYPRMAGPGHMSGPSHMSMGEGGRMYRSDMGGNRFYMRHSGDYPRTHALAQPNGGDFRRERFRGDRARFDRSDRFDRLHGDRARFDRSDRFDRRHARFDDGDHRRFRFRNGAFIYFYNGWWYDEPWWTYDTAYVGGAYGDAHVQWCVNHYRSYNPANNTFVSYGGDVLECVSPYGP